MGAMGMRPVPGGVIDIPAQSQVELKASGLHIMCLGKRLVFDKRCPVASDAAFRDVWGSHCAGENPGAVGNSGTAMTW